MQQNENKSDGGMFRSETMGSYYLVMPSYESTGEILNELGDISSIHFVDPEPDLPAIMR